MDNSESKPISTTDELLLEWSREETAAFEGWDFSHLNGRWSEEPLPWDYREVVRQYLSPEYRLLDMGTGGGEFLLTLNHPPLRTFVTEAYPPNFKLCVEKLAPLGVTIRQISDDDIIPYDSAMFDIVLNRHESFNSNEVFRVLKPNGVFITQQVGGENNRTLSELLIGDFKEPLFSGHNLTVNRSFLQSAGFTITQSGESFPYTSFFDIGAVIYYAKVIEWEFPGFSVKSSFNALVGLQKVIEKQAYIKSRGHRFYLVCKKTG